MGAGVGSGVGSSDAWRQAPAIIEQIHKDAKTLCEEMEGAFQASRLVEADKETWEAMDDEVTERPRLPCRSRALPDPTRLV
mgnify:CR=1 FL=1